MISARADPRAGGVATPFADAATHFHKPLMLPHAIMIPLEKRREQLLPPKLVIPHVWLALSGPHFYVQKALDHHLV